LFKRLKLKRKNPKISPDKEYQLIKNMREIKKINVSTLNLDFETG
jgi:hypothetical protein